MAGSTLPPGRNRPQKSAPVHKGPHMGLSGPIYRPQSGAANRVFGFRSLRRFFGCCPHHLTRCDVASTRPGDDVLINAVCTGLIDMEASRCGPTTCLVLLCPKKLQRQSSICCLCRLASISPRGDLCSMQGLCLGCRPKVKCLHLVIGIDLSRVSQVPIF